MKELKEISNSIMNQAKYNSENFKDNVVTIQKKMIRQNPMNSMQYNWQIAQMRKTFVFFYTLPYIVCEEFFRTWGEVYGN